MEPIVPRSIRRRARAARLAPIAASFALGICLTAAAWKMVARSGSWSAAAPADYVGTMSGLMADFLLWTVATSGLAAIALLLWAACSGTTTRRLQAEVAAPDTPVVDRDGGQACLDEPGKRMRQHDGDDLSGTEPRFSPDLADLVSPRRGARQESAPVLHGSEGAAACDAASRLLEQSAQRLEREATELHANCTDLAVLSANARKSSGSAAALAVAARRRALEIVSALDACATRQSAAAASLAGCIEIATAHARSFPQPKRQPEDRAQDRPDRLPASRCPADSDLGNDSTDPSSEAGLIAELAVSSAVAFDEAEAGWRRQRAAMHELSNSLATLANEAAAVHRMVSAQAECSQFNAHASLAVSAHALRLGDDARRLVDSR